MKKLLNILIAALLPFVAFTQVIKLDDYKLPEETDYYNAFKKAKAALPNGGTIVLGLGYYYINTATTDVAWHLEKDNLTIRGQGIDKTFITAPPSIGCTVSNSTRLSPQYVRGYLATDSNYIWTYKNNLKNGDNYVVVKEPKVTSMIKVGDRIMFVAGSHYFDQEFGELCTVSGINKDTVFFKDQFKSSYAIDSVPYGCKTAIDFIIPPIGRTATVVTDKAFSPTKGRMINIGDNIFSVTGWTTSTKSIYVTNIGKGNDPAGTVIKPGTPMMKGRQIHLWNHTKNFKLQDLTVLGQQDRVLRLDNTYGAEIKNVKVVRNSASKSGFAYTLDFCRDIKFDHCWIESWIDYAGSQISRSSGDITFFKTLINYVKTDCSENCFNVKFDSCEFNLFYDCNFVLGNTVRESAITNCTFNLIDTMTAGVIASGELQNINNVQRKDALIYRNTFNISKYASVIVDLPIYGKSRFAENRILGGSMNYLSNSLNRVTDNSALYPTDNRLDDNYIETRVLRCLIYGGIYSGHFIRNTVINTSGKAVPVVQNWSNLSRATIADNQFKAISSSMSAPSGAVIMNNTFDGQIQSRQQFNYLLLIVVLLVVILLALIIYFLWKKHKKNEVH